MLTNLDPAPWSGDVFRHIPEDSPIGVLDFRFAGQSDYNRWNVGGESTLYLASDVGVALGELARHFDTETAGGVVRWAEKRRIFRLHARIDHLLNLWERKIGESLGLENAPYCFLDRSLARETARYLRRATKAQAIIVPSMAFLEDSNRWVLVAFLEKLPSDPRQFLTAVEPVGSFRVEI